MINRIRRVFVAALALCPITVVATLPAPVTLKELYSEAEHVLLVQVVEGRILGSREQPCGARYAGLVERSFKGAPKGSRVEFGPYHQLRLGNYYLVFLASPTNPSDRYISTNDRTLAAREDYLKRCKNQMAPFAIMHLGFGAMAVDDFGADMNNWVINWRTIIKLPKSVQMKETKTDALVTIGEIEKAFKQESGR